MAAKVLCLTLVLGQISSMAYAETTDSEIGNDKTLVCVDDEYAEEKEDSEVNSTVIEENGDESDAEILHSGVSGDLEWKIDSNKKLTISGSGNYEETYSLFVYGNGYTITAPGWCEYADDIHEVDLKNLDFSNITSMKCMFGNCLNLDTLDLSNFDTTNVTDMSYMFYGCSGLKILDLSNFDTTNVTCMRSMFEGCYGLKTLELSNFDTTNVTCMRSMFNGCFGLKTLELSDFDTTNVTDMASMFDSCSGLKILDLSNFDTTNVTSMHSMFIDCSELEMLNLSAFDTTNVTDMSSMFCACPGLKTLELSNFDTTNVMDMHSMFDGCSGLKTLELSNFDTTNVTDMASMFEGCYGLDTLDLSNFNTANVTDMTSMFDSCSGLKTLDLSAFNTTNVIFMYGMFRECSNLTSYITISSNVNTYTNCFVGCSTEPNSKFTVKYDKNCSKELAQQIVDTKSEDSNVYLEGTDIDEDSEYFVLNQDTNSFGHNLRSFYTVKRYVCKSDETKKYLESLYDDTECVVDLDKWTKYAVRNAVHGDDPKLIKLELRWEDKDGNYHEGVVYQEIEVPGANYRTDYLNRVLDGAGIAGRAAILSNVNSVWNGSCYGVETSMIYNNIGDLINVFGKQKYHDLGRPVENTRLRDVINYYQLCQYRGDHKEDYITYKGWKFLPGSNSVSLEEFLEKLVNEAKNSKNSRKPFLLGYHETDSGHSVIVCGYQFGNIKDHGNGYRIQIYDCNNNYANDYLYMFISEDFSSFEFIDGNKVNVGKDWKDLFFIGVDNLENAQNIVYEPRVSKLAASTEQDTVVITMSAYTPFNLTNASGETLSYDGEMLSGSMKIYSSKILGDTDAEMFLEVDASNNFTFTNIDNNFKASAEIDGQYYMAKTIGADSIVLSLDEGVTLRGESYTFSSAITGDLESCEMVQISGETSGECTLNTTEDGMSLNSENDCSDIWVETYSGTEYNKEEPENSTKSILITDGSDGEVEIKTDDKPDAVTNLKASAYGKNKVLVQWTKSANADGYLVYGKRSSKGKYGYIGMTTKNDYYVDNKALDADYNFYWVYPYKLDDDGKKIINTSCKYVYAKGICAGVTNLKAAAAGKNKVKLTWTASANAEGYVIYGRKDSGTYGYMGMTSKTIYTDSKAADNEYNFYWVYPYMTDSAGKRAINTSCKYVYAKGVCIAVTNLKATGQKGSVKLTWTKSQDADGYLIYGRKDSGTYGYMGMTSKTSYIDKKAAKTEYNFYWVYPYHKGADGKIIVGQGGKYVYGKAK